MAVTREGLYPRVEKLLRKRFTRFDGWDLMDRTKTGPDFILSLKFKNLMQKVICVVSAESRLSPGVVEQMHRYEKAAAGKDVLIFARIIAVPEDASIAADIRKNLEKEGIELLRIPATS
jgi:hypothetical protein